MSVINFLFGNRTAQGFQLSGVVEFSADLTIEEGHERSAQVTQHPIETNAKVSDHVILEPERLTITGFVSDSGVAVFGAAYGATQNAFDMLDAAWAAREPLTVVSGYKTYKDMVITNLYMPRERPESMQFDIEMQNVPIVSSETAELAETDSAQTANETGATNNAGRQPTTSASPSTTQAATKAKEASDTKYSSTLAGFF